MNERLRELAEQAKLNEPFDCGALTKEQWLEKFSRLIVGECITSLEELHRYARSNRDRRIEEATIQDCIFALKDIIEDKK